MRNYFKPMRSRSQHPKRRVILFVCNTAFGLFKFRLNLMKELALSGHTIIAASPLDAYAAKLTEHGFKHVQWNVDKRGVNPARDAIALLHLLAIFLRYRPDVAVLYTIKSVVYGALVSKLLFVPQVSVVTGLGNSFIANGFFASLARWLFVTAMRFADRCVFLNNNDLQQVRVRGRFLPRRVKIIPGEGVDTDHFSPALSTPRASSGRPVVLMVSRVLVEKGILEFCEAIQELRLRGIDIDARLLGAYVEAEAGAVPRKELERHIKSGSLSFIGYRDDVRDQLGTATCVVLPSYREGLPLSLLEAAAMGVPAVATDVPGCRDVVVDGLTGFLCPPRDTPGLADAIECVLRLSSKQQAAMGQRARERVLSQYSQQVICPQYLDLIEGCFS